jgi:hypothetical protein
MEDPKLKNNKEPVYYPAVPLLGIHPGERKSVCMLKKYLHPIIAPLFTIATKWA